MSDHHEPAYKRQVDMWIKLMLVFTPILSLGISWGVTQAQLQAIRENISEIKGWITAHQQFTIDSVRETGAMSNNIKTIDENISDIRRIVEKRLK